MRKRIRKPGRFESDARSPTMYGGYPRPASRDAAGAAPQATGCRQETFVRHGRSRSSVVGQVQEWSWCVLLVDHMRFAPDRLECGLDHGRNGSTPGRALPAGCPSFVVMDKTHPATTCETDSRAGNLAILYVKSAGHHGRPGRPSPLRPGESASSISRSSRRTPPHSSAGRRRDHPNSWSWSADCDDTTRYPPVV